MQAVNFNQRLLTSAGALLAATGMGLAAVGSHLLATQLEPAALRSFEAGVQFQCLNALGTLVMAWWAGRTGSGRILALTGWGLVSGVMLFSGSIYATHAGWLESAGPLAPIGGTLVIVSWLAFAFACLRPRPAGG